MSRRLRHAVLIAVLAFQALVAPALFAASSMSQPTMASSQCPDQMGHDDSPCPCCPDGTMVAGCLSLCTAFTTGFGIALPSVIPVPTAAVAFDPLPASTQIYAPLNPPPIS